MITAIRSLSFMAVLAATALAAAPAGALAASGSNYVPSASLSAVSANHVGMHSMLYTDTPYGAKEEMFRQAKAVGASYIRADLALSGVFLRGTFNGQPIYGENWTRTDEYAHLSNKYGVKVLAVIYSTPSFIADCPADAPTRSPLRCAAGDLDRYEQMVGTVAARYAGVINDFEIINEPDVEASFYGTPAQYAAMLSAAADAIHAANPRGRVAIGGIARISETKFTDAVLAAQPSLPSKIDINTMHLRSSSYTTAMNVSLWRQYFDDHGMRGPLWLTEFGYPSAKAFQYDPKYKSGEAAQASYLAATLPGILGGGGELIFVTQRDWGPGNFASEGILDTADPLPSDPKVRRKASFEVVKKAAHSLTPAPLEPPRGIAQLASTAPQKIKLQGRSVRLAFSCVAAGDCAPRAFRLSFSGGGALRVKSPALAAGKTGYVSVRLTRPSVSRITRAGYKGVRATLADYGRTQSQSLRIRR